MSQPGGITPLRGPGAAGGPLLLLPHGLGVAALTGLRLRGGELERGRESRNIAIVDFSCSRPRPPGEDGKITGFCFVATRHAARSLADSKPPRTPPTLFLASFFSLRSVFSSLRLRSSSSFLLASAAAAAALASSALFAAALDLAV